MPKKPIEHYQHPDKRANIPTQELSGLAEEAETHPETTLYPRDTSLDPQLVWKGKDEQDENALGVHAVPIYAQEHIQPEAIIQMLRKMAIEENSQTEPLFEGFSALELEERVEFYQHEQNWNNRLILGDSLLVMNSLAEKEA
ncbi:site-specific DNA-methyltransferase, partial [Candidatus Poribacteria bacterium]